jgi:hypothetical protein
MAITLADAQVNTQDDVDYFVIDEFRKSSALLDAMTFDDAVTPGVGGATLTYGYNRVTVERAAAFRAVNNEYVAADAKRDRYTVDLKPLGGSFGVDRVLANLGPAASNEVNFQFEQLAKSVRTRFQDELINGDVAADANGFDGLDKALTGSATEVTGTRNWTNASITSEVKAQEALDELDELLALLDGPATALLGNIKSIGRVRALARRSGYYTRTEDAFGRLVESYGNVILIDLGAKAGSNDPIIPVTAGVTDLYAVRLGLDGLHGVSLVGAPLVQTFLPDFTQPGAVKKGEAEMVTAMALKATKAVGVLRGITVAAAE